MGLEQVLVVVALWVCVKMWRHRKHDTLDSGREEVVQPLKPRSLWNTYSGDSETGHSPSNEH